MGEKGDSETENGEGGEEVDDEDEENEEREEPGIWDTFDERQEWALSVMEVQTLPALSLALFKLISRAVFWLQQNYRGRMACEVELLDDVIEEEEAEYEYKEQQ